MSQESTRQVTSNQLLVPRSSFMDKSADKDPNKSPRVRFSNPTSINKSYGKNPDSSGRRKLPPVDFQSKSPQQESKIEDEKAKDQKQEDKSRNQGSQRRSKRFSKQQIKQKHQEKELEQSQKKAERQLKKAQQSKKEQKQQSDEKKQQSSKKHIQKIEQEPGLTDQDKKPEQTQQVKLNLEDTKTMNNDEDLYEQGKRKRSEEKYESKSRKKTKKTQSKSRSKNKLDGLDQENIIHSNKDNGPISARLRQVTSKKKNKPERQRSSSHKKS